MSGRLRALGSVLLSVPVTLFGLILVTFLIGRVMPIDPIIAILGDHAREDAVAKLRLELGLDRSLPAQFFIYLDRLLHGDLGTSVMTSHTVVHDIGQFFPATLELATFAMILGVLLGVPLGVTAAVRQGTKTDHAIRVFCLAGHSIPVFVLGLVSLLVFYAKLGWVPGTGRIDVAFDGMVPSVTGFLTVDALLANDWDAFWSALGHLIQPGGVLGYFSVAYIARMTRAFMLDALVEEYVTTARAKGLSPLRVIWRHAFPNILVRLITILALSYAGLVEGAVVTETIFSWPGLGQYLTVSLLNADMNAVLGATLVIGVSYMALNLLADLAYQLLDPRVL